MQEPHFPGQDGLLATSIVSAFFGEVVDASIIVVNELLSAPQLPADQPLERAVEWLRESSAHGDLKCNKGPHESL